MKSITIDDDVYEFIASNTKEIGEPASKILRRLLQLNSETNVPTSNIVQSDLSIALENKNLKFMSAVDQFLIILGEAYKIKKDSFDKVLDIQGRERKYFARAEGDIKGSGNSTHPKQIPNSPYWVMTNSPTKEKRSLCQKALETIGFSSETALYASKKIT